MIAVVLALVIPYVILPGKGVMDALMTVKTAISIDDALFDKIEALAAELKLSRSGFLSLAAGEFIERYENRRMLEAINEVYADGPDDEEVSMMQQQRQIQRRLVEGQW